MRELKFKCWSNNKMHVPFDLHEELTTANTYEGQFPTDSIFLQFTGLTDKNGKEIYEGDIVKCDSIRRCPHTVIWTGIWNQNLGSVPGWYLSNLSNPGYSFTGGEEVIGNIYENPELLT